MELDFKVSTCNGKFHGRDKTTEASFLVNYYIALPNFWQPLMETWRDIKENSFPERQLNHIVTGSARKLPAVGQYHTH